MVEVDRQHFSSTPSKDAAASLPRVILSFFGALLIPGLIAWLAIDRLQHPTDNHFAAAKGQFKQSLDKFLARTDISQDEKTNTLAQISVLLESDEGKVSKQERKTAAQQVLYHAAEPDSTWQGSHPTCGANSIAHLLYLKNPSLAARMVTECLLTGRWQYKDEPVASIPDQDLPRSGKDGLFPLAIGSRSYAMQLTDAVIMNDIGVHVAPPMQYLEGDFSHSTGASAKGSENSQPNETSSNFSHAWRLSDGRLLDASKAGAGNFSQSGGITPWQAADELNRLTGKKQTILRLRAFESNDKAPEYAKNEALPDHGFVYYTSVSDLENLLTKLKSSGSLPILACVNSEWLRKISVRYERPASSPTKLSDEDHFVCVDDFRPAQQQDTARVRFHDAGKKDMCVWLPVQGFYDGSR